MSFFARLGSDSDSDSSGSDSEESILSGEEGERQDARIARPAGRANQFLRSDDDDSDEFFLAHRGHPADELIDTAGSIPSNHDDCADATAHTSAPAGQKRAASAFADEDAMWSS